MVLAVWFGHAKTASDAVILHALKNPPYLLIDCANRADPFNFISHVDPEAFDRVFVVSFDLLYSLPDALRESARQCAERDIDRVAVTAFYRLFHYQDPEENADVILYSWELLERLARRFHVDVAVPRMQLPLARRFADRFVEVDDGTHRLKPKTGH